MSNASNQPQAIHEVVADPTALGLFGLAIVTLVASTQKLGLTTGTSMVIPWAVFLGGLVQIMAGIYDFKHNNIFGATVFSAYGFFWVAVAWSWMIGMGVFGPAMAAAADVRQLGVAFWGYLIFSVAATVAASAVHKTLFIDMCFICLLFFGLGMDTLGIGGHWAHKLAAYSEMIIAFISFYACCATFLNKFFGRVVLPLGKAVPLVQKA